MSQFLAGRQPDKPLCPDCGEGLPEVILPPYVCVNCDYRLRTNEHVAVAVFVGSQVVLIQNGRGQARNLWQLPRTPRYVFETPQQAAWRGFATQVLGQSTPVSLSGLVPAAFLMAVQHNLVLTTPTASLWSGHWPEAIPFVATQPVVPPLMVGPYANISAKAPEVLAIATWAVSLVPMHELVNQSEYELICLAWQQS